MLGKPASPNSSAFKRCWSVKTSVGTIPCASSARATGRILMASGLVPTTSLISVERSLPPSSAGGDCLRYGLISTEIVGVGLDFHLHRRRGHDMVAKAVLVAVGDRGFPGLEVD